MALARILKKGWARFDTISGVDVEDYKE